MGSDRLFEQPVVKVLPDGNNSTSSNSNSDKNISSTKQRKKVSDMDLSNLSLPPTVAMSSISLEDSKDIQSKLSEDHTTNEKDTKITSTSDKDESLKTEDSSSKITDSIQPNSNNSEAKPSIPSYANITNTTSSSEIDVLLHKDEIVTKTDTDNTIPAYARVSSNSNSNENKPNIGETKEEISIPAYARVPPSNSTKSPTNSYTELPQSSAPNVPSYAQFSLQPHHNQPIKPQPTPQTNTNYTPSYLSNLEPRKIAPTPQLTPQPTPQTNTNYTPSYLSNLEPRKTAPTPVIRTPVSIPARPDYLMYHGPRTSQTPIPKPSVSASSWMNVYQSQSSDEVFVLEQWFQSVDQDHSGEIDSDELAAALNAAGDTFDKGTIALMVKIFDLDRNGTIDFPEFTKLFKYINVMRQSFDSFDTSKRGVLNEQQTKAALFQAKYNFNDPRTITLLFDRFKKPQIGGLTFELFMQMAIVLGNLRTLFTLHDTTNSGYIQLNEEEFILLDCAQYT